MIANRFRVSAFILLIAAVLLEASSTVYAQSIDHKFRLGVESRLFRFASSTMEQDDTSLEETITQIEVGLFSFGGATSNVLNIVALPASSFGCDFAFGVSDNVLIGSRFVVDYGSVDGDEFDISSTQVAFAPHLDYVFISNKGIQPFLGVQAGMQAFFYSVGADGDDADMSSTLFMMGASLGFLGFISDSVSIDPRISFLYSLGSAELSDRDADTSSISVAIMLGFSGWV